MHNTASNGQISGKIKGVKLFRSDEPNYGLLRSLRWVVIGVTFLLIILHEASLNLGLAEVPSLVAALLVDAALLLIGVVAFLSVDRLLQQVDQNHLLKQRLEEAEKNADQAYDRLSMVFRTSQMFAEVSDEKEVIELLLRLTTDLVGSKGASFVPIDERGHTLPALSYGDLPYPEVDAWVEYLASPTVRQGCQSCKSYEHLTRTCPLLQGSFSGTTGAYCLPVRRGEREYGVLNLYISQPGELDPEAQSILRTIVDETTLALEGVNLRRREVETLRNLQAVREKTDLRTLLESLLKSLQESLDADFALVAVWNGDLKQSKNMMASNELPTDTGHLVDGILHSVITSGRPVLLGNVSGENASTPGFKSLMAAPLIVQDLPALGALLVANGRSKTFNPRQLSVLQTIAGQVAMVVHNYDQVAKLEYATMIGERTRLAREIHDGLAQTLGFLKLKTAQMLNYLDQEEVDLLRKTMQTTYDSLSEAYQDVRQAIDGLRISSFESGLSGWLQQTATEFNETGELCVEVREPVADISLPPEVHAQLIRIVQEALSNVRKHAQADQAWISCEVSGGDLILEVRDNGKGFSPEDVPGPSQHGLRGMRERAELIGADFQIIGGRQMGTTIRVRLPLEVGEGVR
jgi:two-component system nitrate/nitrite sensor histidine kinase NarX